MGAIALWAIELALNCLLSFSAQWLLVCLICCDFDPCVDVEMKQQQKAAGEVEKAKKMSIFFFMITLLVVCAKITLGSIIDLDSFFTVLLGGSDNY